MKVYRHQDGSPTTRLTLRRAFNLSRGHQNAHKILKRKKRTEEFGSEAWVLKKREKQRLEAIQMKFLKHLLGITKLDKEKKQCIWEKKGSTK